MTTQPTRSYIWLAAAIIIAGVLVSATLYVALGPAGRTVTSTVTASTDTGTAVTVGGSSITETSSSTDCNSLAVSSNGGLPLVVETDLYQCERIFMIPPGSVGSFVVSYRTNVNASSPGAGVSNFTASVVAAVYSQAVTIPIRPVGYTNASGVTVTPSIPSVNVTAVGNESLTVTYTIQVSNDTQGFFELEYLDSCPSMVPLAVGYQPSQVNASAFPDYQPFLQGCFGPAILTGGTLLSVSGIQMGWMVQSIQRSLVAADDPGALQLQLSLNATSISPGESVRVSVEDYNTLPEVNNVTAATDWPMQGLSIGPCGTVNLPIGFEVLSGRYTDSNLSSGRSVQLYEPGIISCPGSFSVITTYAFLPMNSTASIYGSCNPEPCSARVANASYSVRGSWGTSLLGSNEFSTLAPGVYTVVAGTEWGNLALAYFTVS